MRWSGLPGAATEAQAKADALFTFLGARGLVVDDARRASVLACRDLGLLDRWIARAATAPTLDAVFADAG